MVLWGTPSSIRSSGHPLARLHGLAHDPCFFLDNLHTPLRSHTNYDFDLKLILLVFTSPRCDLLLHSLKRSLALKRSYCILVSYDLCSEAHCVFINLWMSKVFHTLSAIRSIWHTCLLLGHCPIPKFSHTETTQVPWRLSENRCQTCPCLCRQAAFSCPSFILSEDVQSHTNTGRIWAARREPKFYWVVQLRAKETCCQFTWAVHFPDGVQLLL